MGFQASVVGVGYDVQRARSAVRGRPWPASRGAIRSLLVNAAWMYVSHILSGVLFAPQLLLGGATLAFALRLLVNQVGLIMPGYCYIMKRKQSFMHKLSLQKSMMLFILLKTG